MALVSDIGKTIASVRRGSVVYNFFNTTIMETTQVRYVDEFNDKDGGSVRYVFSATNTAGYNYRALHYVRSFSESSIDTIVRPVLYTAAITEQTSRYGIPAIPVYEAIAPSISKYGDDGKCQISWWSNINGILEPDADDSTNYSYDSSKIMKFSATSLGDVQQNANSSKILCSANIVWERLKQVGGVGNDKFFWDVPIIQHITILQCISGMGYVTDFATGGGRGGLGIHAHTNNKDGGLAVATFAPSAMMRPIAWS